MCVLRSMLVLLSLVASSGCSLPDLNEDGDVQDDDSHDQGSDCEPCDGNYNIINENNLEAVEFCASVTGYLKFIEEGWLQSIFLPCLTWIGDDLYLHDNSSLSDLDGLSNLVSVGGDLHIDQNISLKSLGGLSSLAVVNGQLWLHLNPSLTMIDLPRVESVGDDMNITAHYDALVEIDMPSLESVGGDLILDHNGPLTSISLPNLESVGGYLSIQGNAAVVTLEGLSGLTSVGGALLIAHNDCLEQSYAEAFAASIDVGASVSVHDNGTDYPCP